MDLLPTDGILVYNSDDKNVKEVVKGCKGRLVSYGLNSGDYQAIDREIMVGRNQFTVKRADKRVADIALKMFGPHNTLNALSVYTLAKELGWSEQKILQGLASFTGVKRRQEIIVEVNGIKVIEDFAHHPTAVRLTIQTMKEQYRGQRVLAVFEPRSATSRRKIFQQDYIEALAQADISIIAKAPAQEKIEQADRFSSEKLVEDIRAKGSQSIYCKDTAAILSTLKGHSQPGDIILIMSNGGFGGIYSQLKDVLGS